MNTVRIARYNPETDNAPHVERYEYLLQAGMTVLDVLNCVHDTIDSTLAYSYCCRNGHCGLCALRVNGRPALSCKKPAEEDMLLEALAPLSPLKDLLVSRNDYERLRPQLRLFLERRMPCEDEPEAIDMEAYERFKVASRCIECYSCVSACPVYAKRPHSFLGPAAFVLEARHIFDSRDTLDRSLVVADGGIGFCVECGLCSKACPAEADPYGAIVSMKKMLGD